MERKITIEEKTLYKEDYQIRMLRANDLEGILKMGGRGINGNSYYDYDVSGKVSMKAMFERSKIKAEDIKRFLKDLKAAVREIETFLLNIHCILLKPEYIFYDEGKFFFCYYPLAQQNLWEEFHVLTEYFVKQADYQEQECVRITFLLHKKTMEENYSLEKLTAMCLQEEPAADEGIRPGIEQETEREEEKENTSGSIDTEIHDWITEQEMGGSILRETENLWMPVKKFLNKHKKSKWGDWDGLHIEEEEL